MTEQTELYSPLHGNATGEATNHCCVAYLVCWQVAAHVRQSHHLPAERKSDSQKPSALNHRPLRYTESLLSCP